jgi:hypothetical protein
MSANGPAHSTCRPPSRSVVRKQHAPPRASPATLSSIVSCCPESLRASEAAWPFTSTSSSERPRSTRRLLLLPLMTTRLRLALAALPICSSRCSRGRSVLQRCVRCEPGLRWPPNVLHAAVSSCCSSCRLRTSRRRCSQPPSRPACASPPLPPSPGSARSGSPASARSRPTAAAVAGASHQLPAMTAWGAGGRTQSGGGEPPSRAARAVSSALLPDPLLPLMAVRPGVRWTAPPDTSAKSATDRCCAAQGSSV